MTTPRHPIPDDSAIIRYLMAHPEVPDPEIGAQLISGLTKPQLAELAASYVTDKAQKYRRMLAGATEKAATVPVEKPPVRPLRDPEAELIREFEDWRDDPLGAYGDRAKRKRFREWMGEEPFAEWHQKGLDLAEGISEKRLFRFEKLWWPKGQYDYLHMRHREAIYDLIEDVSEQVELETTQDLLATLFALGDGSKVSWGDATVEQHEQRIALLAKNATGVVETAARHQAAIRMIREAGVGCLAEVAKAEEPAA